MDLMLLIGMKSIDHMSKDFYKLFASQKLLFLRLQASFSLKRQKAAAKNKDQRAIVNSFEEGNHFLHFITKFGPK